MDGLYSIAIDGPSGAGKSTLARRAAERFGFLYVDTGAIYRTVGLAARRRNVAPDDAAGVQAMLPALSVELRHDGQGVQRMYLDGEDVSAAIRLPEISVYASKVSAIPAVRAYLLDMQRRLARTRSVIMDGRDIGTVVLPDAGLKVFLTASPEARADRRARELREKGVDASYDEVLRDIRERDERDSSRAAAPLRAADDAVYLDTTDCTLEESVERLCGMIKDRFGL